MFKENNGLIDKSISIKTDLTDKNTEKYKKIINDLLTYSEKFFKICFSSMINLNESYKYIKSKYLQKEINNIQNIKKEEAKKNLINKEQKIAQKINQNQKKKNQYQPQLKTFQKRNLKLQTIVSKFYLIQ